MCNQYYPVRLLKGIWNMKRQQFSLMTHTCLRSVNASCNVPSLKPGTGSELANTAKRPRTHININIIPVCSKNYKTIPPKTKLVIVAFIDIQLTFTLHQV